MNVSHTGDSANLAFYRDSPRGTYPAHVVEVGRTDGEYRAEPGRARQYVPSRTPRFEVVVTRWASAHSGGVEIMRFTYSAPRPMDHVPVPVLNDLLTEWGL